jgi:starvation-inducible DNA-binding protein
MVVLEPKVIEILNARLADTVDLKTQVKHAHWNVKGIHFFQLHELFDSVASHLEDQSDLIAERVTQLGGVANGTARQAASDSTIKEYDFNAVKGEDHVRALVERLGTLANAARKAIDDTGKLATRRPRMCSPRSPARQTKTCGSWKLICRLKAQQSVIAARAWPSLFLFPTMRCSRKRDFDLPC